MAKATVASGSVHVRFDGKSDERVEMQQRGVTTGECRMPCALDLQPGAYTLRSGTYEQDIEIPVNDTDVAFKRGCKACWITGGILTAASIPLFIGGKAIINSNAKGDGEAPGYAAIGTGVIFAVSGLALLVVGIAVGSSGVVVKEHEQQGRWGPSAGLRIRPSRDGGLGFSF